MATYQNRIMARSPYYITATGFTFITSATLKLYIWDGDNSITPTTPTYTLTKNALTTTSGDITFEISALIRDYFIHSGKAYSQINDEFVDAVWLETELDVVQVTDPQPATVNNLYLVFDGYSEYVDGVNYTGTDVIVNTIDVFTGSDVELPVFVNSDGADEIEFYADNKFQSSIDLSLQESSTLSYDKVYYMSYTNAINDIDEIRLKQGGIVISTISVNYIDECKYTPKQIRFINKNGLLHTFYAFKKSVLSLNSKRDTYNRNVGSVKGSAYTYNPTAHQRQDYNVTGNESITLNTGWINEDKNVLLEQLLRSRDIWVDDIPVRLKTNSLELKTRLNDKLINYTLSFDYAHDFINHV